ncbi:hypothetical protein HZS_2028, partial [Henneguya salminicola]
MKKLMQNHVSNLTKKWKYPSTHTEINVDCGDISFMYNTTNLEWIYSSKLPSTSLFSSEITNTEEMPCIIRSYMTIPSYLLLYRLLHLFGHPDVEPPNVSEMLWRLVLIHNKTNSLVFFQDYRAGMKFYFSKGKADENLLFRYDLIELLNLLAFPFYRPEKINSHYYSYFSIRQNICKTSKTLRKYLYQCGKDHDGVNVNLEVLKKKYLKNINYSDILLNDSKIYYTYCANFYCYFKNYIEIFDEDNVDNHDLIITKFHITNRIPLNLYKIVFDENNKEWLVIVKETKEGNSIYFSLRENRI